MLQVTKGGGGGGLHFARLQSNERRKGVTNKKEGVAEDYVRRFGGRANTELHR